jgi:hypothetical protein
MKKTSPAWSGELESPIVLEDLSVWRAFGPIAPGDSNETQLAKALSEEVIRRQDLIFRHLGLRGPPQTEEGWRVLVWEVCDRANVPWFKFVPKKRRRGAPRIWTDLKHCQLFADVQTLAMTWGVVNLGLSENSACKFIAQRSSKFGGRYVKPRRGSEKAWAATIHRQFTTAKRKVLSDVAFRLTYFAEGDGITRRVPDGNRLIRLAIERYAFGRKGRQTFA